MAILFDEAKVLQEASQDPYNRYLIIEDQYRGHQKVWTKFFHPYDRSTEQDVTDLLDDTISTLKLRADSVILTDSTLPIVRYIGIGKITKLTRLRDGSIWTRPIQEGSVASHIGLG